MRYDDTNKEDTMLALLGADSLEEMKEIANGEESMTEVVHHLENMLHGEQFIKKYKDEEIVEITGISPLEVKDLSL